MKPIVFVVVLLLVAAGSYALTGNENRHYISMAVFTSVVLLLAYGYSSISGETVRIYAPFNPIKTLVSVVTFALSTAMLTAMEKWSGLSIIYYLLACVAWFLVLEFLGVLRAISKTST